MPIPIEREPDPEPFENCCFCRDPTPFWTRLKKREIGEQVACCEKCARLNKHKDVPTKEEWTAREEEEEPKPRKPLRPRNTLHVI